MHKLGPIVKIIVSKKWEIGQTGGPWKNGDSGGPKQLTRKSKLDPQTSAEEKQQHQLASLISFED